MSWERRYLFSVPGFGRLIAKDDKQDLERLVSLPRAVGNLLRGYSAAAGQTGSKIIDEGC